ncbi:MAG: PQQ-binding-like beta-propeller repeat protein [Pseudolysinimonas sp.]
MNPAVEAADAATDPAHLAEIAQQHPELAATVAANPATYPGLLEWIVQHGDAAAKAAARVRMGISATPPPPPPAATAPSVASPLVIAGSGPHLSARAFAIGGGVLAVIALIVVGVLVIPSLIGGGGSVTVTTAEILHEPKLDVWTITNPFEGEGSSDDSVSLSTYEVGQDRAVLGWALYSNDTDSISDARASLVDTRTGATIWVVEVPSPVSGAAGGLGNGPTVLAVNDGNNTQLISFDGAGHELSETPLEDSFNLFTASDFSTGHLSQKGVMIGNDVLATGGDGQLLRLSVVDLTQEAWSISAPNGSAAVTADRVVADGHAYSLVTGEALAWNGDPNLYVASGGQGLIGNRLSGEETFDLVGLTPEGDETWAATFTLTTLEFFPSDIAVAAERDSGILSGISLVDGTELWTRDIGQDALGSTISVYGTEIVWFRSGSDDTQWTAIDARTGVELYSDSDIGVSGFLRGGTRNVVYSGSDSVLTGSNPRTGEVLWSVKTQSSDGEYYTFETLGGHVVVEHSLDPSDTKYANETVLQGVG